MRVMLEYCGRILCECCVSVVWGLCVCYVSTVWVFFGVSEYCVGFD